jgi:hypothetical protein
MYKVISIEDHKLFRNIVLENNDTKTMEKVADWSDYEQRKGNSNFCFMKIGEAYECYIRLVGAISEPSDDPLLYKPTSVTITDKKIMFGKRKFFESLINNDLYYIAEDNITNNYILGADRNVIFGVYRKDLIRVNSVIDPKYV